MSKEQRDAFVAGWLDHGRLHECEQADVGRERAFRRYPDIPPAAPKRWECTEQFCHKQFETEEEAMHHTIEFGHQVFPVVALGSGEGEQNDGG